MPHNGCPHQCSFCNQRSITGKSYQPKSEDVVSAIKLAKDTLKEDTKNAQIAFFGGSFTAIDREYMLSLLEATSPYIDSFNGIRISTRPDYIDDEILELLKKYKVTSIELGAQSMNDEVLKANERGHTAQDVIDASSLIKSYGFELGLQMMTGLYKSNDDIDIQTAEKFIEIKPDTVRIYPTVVMKNTKLEELYKNGEYIPPSLENAVNLCSKLLLQFDENNIKVIRLGLHFSQSLETDMVAGAYHPSFKELCESKILFDKVYEVLSNKKQGKYNVKISPKCVSKLIGNNKSNIKKLKQLGYELNIIPDNSVQYMHIEIV